MISPGLLSETLGRKSLGFFQRLRDAPFPLGHPLGGAFRSSDLKL